MKPLRTLLADDEPNARTRLRKLLQNDERVEIIGEASDGLEAVAEIEGLRPNDLAKCWNGLGEYIISVRTAPRAQSR